MPNLKGIEVIVMNTTNELLRAERSLEYWGQWLLLTLFGPAQQDREHDPIEILRRKYGRSSPHEGEHI
jgi:hypothetical protein